MLGGREDVHTATFPEQLGSENEAVLHFTLLKVAKQLQYNLSKIFHTETAISISGSSVSSMAAI